MSKVVEFDELESIRGSAVLAHGCFDFFHVGHLLHLEEAKKLGKTLVVTITSDYFVTQSKGEGRPVFNEVLRAKMLAGLACVDYVAIAQGPTAMQVIERLRPAVYVKGGEYRDKMTEQLQAEVDLLYQLSGKLAFTDSIEFHSTELLKRWKHLGYIPKAARCE